MAKDKKNPLTLILIGCIAALIIMATIFSHIWTKKQVEEKYRQDFVQIDVRIDSLRQNELRLHRSLDSLKNVRDNLVIVRTVYKTVYDTVYLKAIPVQIVDGLNTIISTPIPSQK